MKEKGFPEDSIHIVSSLEEATVLMREFAGAGDTVLFENDLPDNYDRNMPDSPEHIDRARHVKPEHEENPQQAHPSGIPVPDAGSSAEYVPMPGDNRTVIAPNGAIIRNPWSEQTEIEPDNEYTPEKEDLNLIQL